VLPDLTPMLADRGLPAGGFDSWAVEPKLDGWRVMVLVDPALPKGVAVRTRRAVASPTRCPGSQRSSTAVGASSSMGSWWPPPDGRPTSTRWRHGSPAHPTGLRCLCPSGPSTLLWLDRELLVDRPYVERLMAFPWWGRAVSFPGVPVRMFTIFSAACVEHDVEGVVLKRLISRYRPGERSIWRKVKAPGWATVHAQRRRPP
jgi:bifunctional non-homologous end joining protein LigD